jgi:hypothetical protein
MPTARARLSSRDLLIGLPGAYSLVNRVDASVLLGAHPVIGSKEGATRGHQLAIRRVI